MTAVLRNARLFKIETGGLSKCAASILRHQDFTVSEICKAVDLVALNIEELGFTHAPRTEEFMTEIFCALWSKENLKDHTLQLCIPEDALQLWKRGMEQDDTVVWFAMQPVPDFCGDPRVFGLEQFVNGKSYLRARCARPDLRWHTASVIIFRLCKVH